MDVAPGGDLSARIRREPLPPREAAEIARSLAAGLGHAHAQGVLHRDLKPANVLFDDQGAPRLTDFGLARIAGAEDLTQTGQILGTPAYMAPEQASAGAVDERTDVYGLGAILFATLTGRAPFVGPSVLALLASVSEGGAPPVRSLNSEVPEALGRICDRCLERSPSDRYPSARALEESLDAYLCGRFEIGSRGRSLALWGILCVTIGLALGGALLSREGDPEGVSPISPSALARESRDRSLQPSGVEALSLEEFRDLRNRLGSRQSLLLSEVEEIDQAIARGGSHLGWLRSHARTPLVRVPNSQAREVRDLGEGAFLVLGQSQTWLYDVWSPGKPRRAWSGAMAALSRDRSWALLISKKVARLVDIENGGVLGKWLLPREIQRARFVGPGHLLLALKHDKGAELLRLEPFGEGLRTVCVLEGLKDFVLTPDALIMGWGLADASGGFAARSLANLEGKDLWNVSCLGDGAPSAMALPGPSGRIALGTLSGRIHLIPSEGPSREISHLATDLAGLGVGRAQVTRAGRLLWLGPGRLLVGGSKIYLWEEGPRGWERTLAIEVDKNLSDFDLSHDRRRLLVVSGGVVTQRLLSGYLPGQASAAPLFAQSARARAILAYARWRLRPGSKRSEGELERARAGADFVLSRLTLQPELRARVLAWRRTLRHRRSFEDPVDQDAQVRGKRAEDAGALDAALVHYQNDLRLRPSDPMAHFRIARTLIRLGDEEAALPYLDQAESLIRENVASAEQPSHLERCSKERQHLEELRPSFRSSRRQFDAWE